MNVDMQELEERLKSFDPDTRAAALGELSEAVTAGDVETAPASNAVNLHCHTFYSYNPYNYSPSLFAWLARRRGLYAAGIIDFDVLDGVDEFFQAARTLNLRATAGMETRVFVPEFAEREINSPGEPGIAYHVGAGMPFPTPPESQRHFLDNLKQTAQNRNRDLIARVNGYTKPLELDFERDVLPLTPNGNATERHICYAYARRAAELYSEKAKLHGFWEEKLGELPADIDLPYGSQLQGLIRKKTMKRGGVGYVQPDGKAFPSVHEVNEFILASGGIPTLTWLNGESEGEQAIDEMLDLYLESGVEAVNIIPDRNFTPGVRDDKLANLQEILGIAEDKDLPVLVGTEMNSPGLKFADDFDSQELASYMPVFLKGARILYAHSMLQREANLGYTSAWGKSHFPDRADRNRFYEEVGTRLEPKDVDNLQLEQHNKPEDILSQLK